MILIWYKEPLRPIGPHPRLKARIHALTFAESVVKLAVESADSSTESKIVSRLSVKLADCPF